MSDNIPTTNESEQYRNQIRKRLKKQQEFKQFLTVWFGVSVMLTLFWLFTAPSAFFWPIFPILGMGLGAFFQWREAYGEPPREITDADIDAEIHRIRNQK
ncbi:MAG: hypothetical protein RI985_1283 [Chloroflexota bacterium]